MSHWQYDQTKGVHTTDSGPQVCLASFLLAALLIRLYFGVNRALGFAAVVAAGTVAGVSIAWIMRGLMDANDPDFPTRHRKRGR